MIEVWSLFESLLTVLFLTDSVFVVLLACFDESMEEEVDETVVVTRPQTVKSLCFSVIPGSVMLTHTVLEGFITE